LERLVFGANVLGWTVSHTDAFALLDHCAALGIRRFDTADHYVTWSPGGQGGESETILGKWLSARAIPDAKIVTKVGFPMSDGSKGLGRAHIRRSIAGSLARLRRDSVEIYMAHLEDPDTPIEETVEAFAELVAEGRTKAVGVSQLSEPVIDRAFSYAARRGLPSFTVYETLYNLYEREPFESQGARIAARYGMQVLPYRSLAAGFLTGKYRSADDLRGKARGARVGAFLDARGLRVLAALDAVAAETGYTPARIAIAWLAARPLISAILASATTAEQIDEQLAGSAIVLDPAHVALLDAASAIGVGEG